MIKVMTMFFQAEDNALLEDYYYNQYLPMVIRVPGLIKVETTRYYSDLKKVLLKKSDVSPLYQITSEIYFEDLEAFERSFSSPAMEELANNLINVAWDLVSGYIGETNTITPEEYERNPTFIRKTYRS